MDYICIYTGYTARLVENHDKGQDSSGEKTFDFKLRFKPAQDYEIVCIIDNLWGIGTYILNEKEYKNMPFNPEDGSVVYVRKDRKRMKEEEYLEIVKPMMAMGYCAFFDAENMYNKHVVERNDKKILFVYYDCESG